MGVSSACTDCCESRHMPWILQPLPWSVFPILDPKRRRHGGQQMLPGAPAAQRAAPCQGTLCQPPKIAPTEGEWLPLQEEVPLQHPSGAHIRVLCGIRPRSGLPIAKISSTHSLKGLFTLYGFSLGFSMAIGDLCVDLNCERL